MNKYQNRATDALPPRPSLGERLLHSTQAAGLVAAGLATLLYAESLSFTYVYDDVEIALEDSRLRDPNYFMRIWWEPWWFRSGSIGESRPLTSLTFWAHMQLHGANPFFPHLFNVLAFGALTYLLALTSSRWLTCDWIAWPVGLLFATHPIHVEAVANLVGRAEVMAAIFSLAAILCWLRWRNRLSWIRAAAIGALVLLAGQSKETGYMSAAIILLGELAERRRERTATANFAPLLPLVTFISLVALYAVVQRSLVCHRIVDVYGQTLGTIDPALNPLVLSSLTERLVTPIVLTGKAAQLLLFPINQAPDYSPEQLSPTANLLSPLGIIGLSVLAIYGYATYFAWRARSRSLGPLLACLVAWSVPSNAAFLIGVMFAERLLMTLSLFLPIALAALVLEHSTERQRTVLAYCLVLASVVFVLAMLLNAIVVADVSFDAHRTTKIVLLALAACAATAAVMRIFTRFRLLACAVVALGCAFGLATTSYIPFWQSWHTLVLTTAGRHPENGRFQGELSNILIEQSVRLNQDMYDRAEEAAQRAIRLFPTQQTPYITLACLAKRRGEEREAIELLRRAEESGHSLHRFAFLLDHFGLRSASPDARAP